jgi:hypothetical protein
MFYRECARHEKNLLVSFANRLYLQIDDYEVDPDADVYRKVKEAVADESLDAAQLREVLKEAQKLYTRPVDIYIPPKDRNTWKRFRGCINSFYEAVCDPCNTVQDNAELMMQNQELKLYVQNLETKIEDTKKIKERFEALEKS